MKRQFLKLTLLLSIAYNALSMEAPGHYCNEKSEVIITGNISRKRSF